MRWVERFRMAMLMLLHRKAESERLNRELEFHLEQQIAENLANGMEPEEARLAALRLFGNPTLLREEAHSSWGGTGWKIWGATSVTGCVLFFGHLVFLPRRFL